MAEIVNIKGIQFERSLGPNGQGINLVCTEATGIKKLQTIKANGKLGDETEAIGIVATDTGRIDKVTPGVFATGEVVRTFRSAWITATKTANLVAGAKVRLGANGTLDCDPASTAPIVGTVFESSTASAVPNTVGILIHWGQDI